MTTTRRQALTLPAGAAALAVVRPDRLAGYTAGELHVIVVCEEARGRALTAREGGDRARAGLLTQALTGRVSNFRQMWRGRSSL
jgi:hypothetical protein